ncbi:oligosaccharide flippase family protein [Aeromonas veronii]
MNYIYSILGLGTNYIYPLLIIPFIISSYGLDGFGRYTVILSIVNCMNVLVSYGFDLSLPSIFKKRVNAIYKKVILSRLIVFAIILIPTPFILISFKVDVSPLMCTILLMILGTAISPNYIAIYNERFSNIFFSGLLSKVLSALLVSLGIYMKSPLELIVLFSVIWMLAGPLLLILMERKYIIKGIKFSDECSCYEIMKLGMPVFLSNALSLCLTSLVVPLVSLLSNFHTAGLYSVFDKIMRGALSLIDSIYSVMYVKSISANKYGEIWFKRIFGVGVGAGIVISFVYFTMGDWFFYILSNYLSLEISKEYIAPLFIGLIIICICSVGNASVVTVLYPANKYNIVNYAVLFSAIFIIGGFLLIHFNMLEATFSNFVILLFIAELLSNLVKTISGLILINRKKYFYGA